MEDVDLRTLQMLDTVVATGSVQLAAQKLGVTPSAVSHGLRRLRARTNDELVIATRGGMVPTVRGAALAKAVRTAFASVTASLSDGPFEAASSERTFTIGAADYASSVLGAAIFGTLRREAPHVTVKLGHLRFDVAERLEAGELDVAIAPFGIQSQSLKTSALFQDRFLCAARRGHPRFHEIGSLAGYLAASHICVAPAGLDSSFVDDTLDALGHRRDIVLRLPFFLAALECASASDLVVTLPRSFLARFAKRFDLEVTALPFEIAPLRMAQTWHVRRDNEPAHRWLRSLLARAAKSLSTARARG